MTTIKVSVQRLSSMAKMPTLAYENDACWDLYSAEYRKIPSKNFGVVDTALVLGFEPGWEGQIRGRSGLARAGILVHAGTIDAGYRGGLGIIVYNLSNQYLEITPGFKLAQLAIRSVPKVILEEVNLVCVDTSRGEKGFGSTGT